jgi:hypothetical protein
MVDNIDINMDNIDITNRTPEAKKYGEPAEPAELVMNAARTQPSRYKIE